MAFAIDSGEPISEAIPRMVMERLGIAHTQLRDESGPVEERVHNARKRFKEARAVVRMVRDALGAQFAVENAWFRDAGRELAGLRDADAVIEALATLDAYTFHERRVVRQAHRRLKRARQRARTSDLQARIDNTARQIPLAKARVTLWRPLDDRFETIGSGLRRTYRDGRRAFRQALKHPSPQAFHEWRKRVKDHWYHTQILRNVWPELMKPYREQMEQLSDALGDRHDLDVLMDVVVEGDHYDARVLRGLIAARAAELTERAMRIGSPIYAERPVNVAARFEAYWNASSPASSSPVSDPLRAHRR